MWHVLRPSTCCVVWSAMSTNHRLVSEFPTNEKGVSVRWRNILGRGSSSNAGARILQYLVRTGYLFTCLWLVPWCWSFRPIGCWMDSAWSKTGGHQDVTLPSPSWCCITIGCTMKISFLDSLTGISIDVQKCCEIKISENSCMK